MIVFSEDSQRFHMQSSATTIIGVALIWACKRMRHRHAQSNQRKLVESSRFQKLVVCIIAMNVEPLNEKPTLSCSHPVQTAIMLILSKDRLDLEESGYSAHEKDKASISRIGFDLFSFLEFC